MSIKENITFFRTCSSRVPYQLVAVSKTKPNEDILEAYNAGQRIFGESKVQELTTKYETLPKDIKWHMIGHLQRNKVKFIAPFIYMIHSVDSFRLLREINKQGARIKRKIDVLLQMHIANEESKFGLSEDELNELISHQDFLEMKYVNVKGLMGMATNTGNSDQVRQEFSFLHGLFDALKSKTIPGLLEMKELSMGMTNDYEIALEEGTTLIRIGSAIFGERVYAK